MALATVQCPQSTVVSMFFSNFVQLPKSITTIAPWHTDCWTQWFDRDNPSGPGDYETLSALHAEYPGKICAYPLQIQVLTTAWHPVSSTGDIIDTSDTVTGFICKNSLQTNGRCSDYQVRFQCPPEFCASTTPCCWTDWFDRDNPSGKGDFEILIKLRKENPGKICNNPLQIQVLTTGVSTVYTCFIVFLILSRSDTEKGFICKNCDQKGGRCSDYKVRFQCPIDFCPRSQGNSL
uniref:WxxW domain-containing protein n=1 Tax=Neogobius melanostomus TaxID=47308 RepID=A0A8C6TSM3_9GOBI